MQPLELRINAARNALIVRWGDGTSTALAAAALRATSRAAGQVRAGLEGRNGVFEGVVITGAEAVGTYAIRLAFSDGHDRGIYPWDYLRDLATLNPIAHQSRTSGGGREQQDG
ncbi:MAG: DUF971 domain-containing protein [Aquamicrobium sp.]|uniref:gamma-butyrobetaine hydroxylase-like domain-containing protein n=1 Tax=Mesorhizobium sp. Pch-S TaxID=2082387 RepID=UPI001013B143|nr:gamma-butyrobetaine hydroxylase-like domain-containing protein [Mesorhizobium sp. Pch-S]MBR2692033.1 DUF971 domain-containing protein [Aquamicrobium sp.]QAZ42602.1 DUF971 domain-containing protein [Mesorhizobium sp. Pch-S]